MLFIDVIDQTDCFKESCRITDDKVMQRQEKFIVWEPFIERF